MLIKIAFNDDLLTLDLGELSPEVLEVLSEDEFDCRASFDLARAEEFVKHYLGQRPKIRTLEFYKSSELVHLKCICYFIDAGFAPAATG